MGLLGAIGGFVSSVCSTVGSICSRIGGSISSGISSFARGLVTPIVDRPLNPFINTWTVLCKIISGIAEALGLKKEEETPEELGYKAEEAGKEGKKPEDFDSTEAYIEYLRKEVKIDQERFDKLENKDKVAYGAIGSALYVKSMEEKYDMKMSPEFWTTVSKMDMKSEEVKAYIDKFKENGMTDMKDMANYIERKPLEGAKSRREMTGIMMETLRELNPDLSEDALADKLFAMGKKE